MKIEYGVAYSYHYSGSHYSNIRACFNDYDSAKEYADTLEDGLPTIYCVIDKKYVFYCDRSQVKNEPYRLYKIETFEGGQIWTMIWWNDFCKNPQKFLHLAEGIL